MALSRHQRVANARKLPRSVLVSAPLATLATVGVVGAGVLVMGPSGPGQPGLETISGAAADLGTATATRSDEAPNRSAVRLNLAQRKESRQQALSSIVAGQAAYEKKQQKLAEQRAERREKEATEKAVAAADTKLWATDDLNLWSASTEDADLLGEVETGDRVLTTGRQRDGRDEIVVDGESRWVTSGYLDDEKPDPATAGGLTMEPCPDSGVESGLTDGAVYVYRSVCHNFPQITSYGGYAPRGEHGGGQAIDIMVSDDTGTQIAEFLRAHAAELNLYDIIWRQRIWTQERSGEGWRYMSDRGSATANHYDHVHVMVY